MARPPLPAEEPSEGADRRRDREEQEPEARVEDELVELAVRADGRSREPPPPADAGLRPNRRELRPREEEPRAGEDRVDEDEEEQDERPQEERIEEL